MKHAPLFVTILMSAAPAALAAAPERTVGEAACLEALGRDCTVVPLWPRGFGPGETRPTLVEAFQKQTDGGILIRPVVKPSMIIIPPPEGVKPNGLTILCCPGGGYGALGTGTVIQTAHWLNAQGATAVLLKYRIPRRGPVAPAHQLPLQDAQRALGLLRSRAKEWNIDPARIGILGYSAGGHLAAMASNHHAKRTYEAVDGHDRVSCRPDFALLLYPAYLTKPIDELKPDPALDQEHMTPTRTPPTFITVTRPDKFTTGCVSYMTALVAAKVPAELHVYESGGHGGSFDKYPLMEWGREAERFLKHHKFLDAATAEAGNAWLRKREPAVRKGKLGRVNTAGGPRTSPKAAPTKSGPIPDAVADQELAEVNRLTRKWLDAAAPVIPVWPKGVGNDDPRPKERPTVTLLRPEKPDGRAVLLCPDVKERSLAFDPELVEATRWLNRQGITVFLLASRGGDSAALPDGQRSLSLVRSRAAQFGIDPAWIGIVGFGVGGKLAALCVHQGASRSYKPVDEHDRVSCRPDFAVLVSPSGMASEAGKVPEALADAQRNRTPPIFIAFSVDDTGMVPALHYLLAVRAARVPIAFHAYLRSSAKEWPAACERWLKDLDPAAQPNE